MFSRVSPGFGGSTSPRTPEIRMDFKTAALELPPSQRKDSVMLFGSTVSPFAAFV